ncbi:hypothetical protein JOC94_000503 [Bacillus thermophilus]|uniref:Uncharacterized protein n=1 Tax=Siminovitchia thermophila TaxID=1245522 RepID=A0ABS2R2D3_9BACI|nr:hypothetical protein [Siminovitchia thermophila]
MKDAASVWAAGDVFLLYFIPVLISLPLALLLKSKKA